MPCDDCRPDCRLLHYCCTDTYTDRCTDRCTERSAGTKAAILKFEGRSGRDDARPIADAIDNSTPVRQAALREVGELKDKRRVLGMLRSA